MVQKRHFYNEELHNISSKHQRRVDYDNQLVSFSELVPAKLASFTNCTPDEFGLTEHATEDHERLAMNIVPRFQVGAGKGVETIVPVRSSNSSWATVNTGEETVNREMAVPVTCPPKFLSHEHPLRTISHCQSMHSLLLHYSPQKAVPIGSNYQAEIPEWSPHHSMNKSAFSVTPEIILDANPVSGEKDENILMGTCVIPMPDLERIDEVGNVKNDCSCLDEGSIKCIRKHIVEAREKLKIILGTEIFDELGFCYMGEQVSEKWSEEEEELFHEVVFSNPPSLGKNFWSHLSAVFPSRTKEDFVCYYFNVFMLRRRAKQNRCESITIYDSDTDEWHESDDYDYKELEMTVEDEDFAVRLPVIRDNWSQSQSHKRDAHVLDEGAEDDIYDDSGNSDVACDGDITDYVENCPRLPFDKCSSNPTSLCQDIVPFDKMLDQEVLDDSCTSSDTGISFQGTHFAEGGDHWQCSVGGVSCGSENQAHILEPCDVKVWDAGYMRCPESKVDFLPTCMIEEAFGDGSWNYEAKDDKGLN